MSTYQDLVDVMRRIQERTGDPLAWMTGLTPVEVSAALAPVTPMPQLEAILAKIRQQHANLFTPPTPPQIPAPPDHADGDAAKAIADAESALAHQSSVTAQLDLQVVSAILNAHVKTVEGRNALSTLQQELETAVRTRSDLDTPAGARDFQRFLIGKLRDIREVVASANLDDTSKSALMAAWTSLYNASKNPAPTDHNPAPATTPAARSAGSGGGEQQAAPEAGSNALPDSLYLDDPGLLAAGTPALEPASAPAVSAAPPSSGAAAPTGGGSMPGLGAPSGLPLPNFQGGGTGRDARALGDGLFADDPDEADEDKDAERDKHGRKDDRDEEDRESAPGQPESPAGPTTVTLPNGETVTAASPQLAAAIKAAAGGTPIPEAFAQQGMTVPAPGTAVAHPIDPSQVAPGDIGMFTDRHALALGRSKALLDGQIQHISTVSGPSFLGWEHPPTPATQTPGTAPAQPDTPTPTRPAAITTS